MYELKLKAMSLAAEARVIKSDEQREKRRIAKWKYKAAIAREKARLNGQAVDPNPLVVSSPQLTGAHLHRVNDVRKEARCALLAYGFLKGRSYREMENFAWTQPNWDRVEKLALRYSNQIPQVILQHFAQWKDEALEGITAAMFQDTQQPGSVKSMAGFNDTWVQMQRQRNAADSLKEEGPGFISAVGKFLKSVIAA